MERVTVRLPETELEQIEDLAETEGDGNQSKMVRSLVESGLAQYDYKDRVVDSWLFYLAVASSFVALGLIGVVLVFRIPAYHMALFASILAIILLTATTMQLGTLVGVLKEGV